MRIFLDANVLFSAMKSDGAIRKLLLLLSQSGHSLVADEYVMSEAVRNLAAKAPGPAWDISQHLSFAPGMSSEALPDEVDLDEKDWPVLAAAIALNCDDLVTGDKTHFGHLFGSEIGGVRICSAAMIAEALLP